MFNIDFTFLWTALNLLIIYLFVNHFLFKRLAAHMVKRAESIESDMRRGKELLTQGEALQSQNEALLKETAGKQRAALEEARQSAGQEYARIVAEAQKEAARIKSDSQAAIEREHSRMTQQLCAEVTDLAITAASRVMEANMDSEANRALVDRFLQEKSKGTA